MWLSASSPLKTPLASYGRASRMDLRALSGRFLHHYLAQSTPHPIHRRDRDSHLTKTSTRSSNLPIFTSFFPSSEIAMSTHSGHFPPGETHHQRRYASRLGPTKELRVEEFFMLIDGIHPGSKQRGSPDPPGEGESDSEEVVVKVRFLESQPERAISSEGLEGMTFASCNSALSLTKLTSCIRRQAARHISKSLCLMQPLRKLRPMLK